MNNNDNNNYSVTQTQTQTHNKIDKKKDVHRAIRVNLEDWTKLRDKAKFFGWSTNELVNKLISYIISGDIAIVQESNTTNVNMNIMQTAVKQEVTEAPKEVLYQNELKGLLKEAQKRIDSGQGISYSLRQDLIRIGTRIKKMDKETLEKVTKLTEF